ncbi:MAG: pilus assembly protein PilP [Neisseria sp.]|jgi:type IV pilus assembly protein PilP|uniref:pilus assembly protein PilP n=1 Tax=Uruburuella suis TaxID=252130 RepID=UPI001B5392A8|nr:pilus assembly protein PilP [Uruburuella suis]MBP6393677.1 pilus assembly protein PilP [Neisseria sp.]MBP8043330.1 pilus assembly protein PilP [Neisseria sp.]MBP8069392.1 pilus assembly protein PilP [Neisseria sp.]
MKTHILLPCLLLLAACGPQHSDLREWMQQTQQQAKTRIQPFEAPSITPVQSYTPPNFSGLNAFNSKRLNLAQQGVNAPDTHRPKELLEGFSLENLKYVGTLTAGRAISGFVEADGHVYTVKPGNYIGQNYGRIQSITSDKITLVEVVEDSYGNWIFRNAELPLNNAADNGAQAGQNSK